MSKEDLCPVTTSEFSSPVIVNGQENITWSTNQTTTERILHAASMNEFVLNLCTHVWKKYWKTPLSERIGFFRCLQRKRVTGCRKSPIWLTWIS